MIRQKRLHIPACISDKGVCLMFDRACTCHVGMFTRRQGAADVRPLLWSYTAFIACNWVISPNSKQAQPPSWMDVHSLQRCTPPPGSHVMICVGSMQPQPSGTAPALLFWRGEHAVWSSAGLHGPLVERRCAALKQVRQESIM